MSRPAKGRVIIQSILYIEGQLNRFFLRRYRDGGLNIVRLGHGFRYLKWPHFYPVFTKNVRYIKHVRMHYEKSN